MKGVIVQCLGNLVTEKFGKDKWEDALEKSGVDRNYNCLAFDDVDDEVIIKVIKSTCEVLDITMSQAADAFGDYWVNNFTQKIYGVYYKNKNNAKEFLLNMDNVHNITTKNIKNARPPRFEYKEVDDKTLIMTYKSHRGLIDILIGLIKGVGKHFNEDLQVRKINDTQVEIKFP